MNSGSRALVTRQGIRAAQQRGQSVGGLRQATARRNRQLRETAIQQADQYRELLAGCDDMNLREISRVLFEAGVTTGSGKPWTHSMVRRLLDRLDKQSPSGTPQPAEPLAKSPAIPKGLSERQHQLAKGVWQLIKSGNVTGLRWMLRMAARDEGQVFVDGLLGAWTPGPQATVIEAALKEA